MKAGYVAVVAFVGTVFAANWLVTHYGLVPVGFGLEAPAGVYAAGLAFGLRDLVQRLLGRGWVVAAILAGAGASLAVGAGRVAVASACAFLVSELCDFAVYTPLERRSLLGAVVASNTVGVVVDSFLFLSIAFGSLALFWGQVVGKSWLTLAVLPLVLASRRFVPNEGVA